MSWFDDESKVRRYEQVIESETGAALVARLEACLSPGSRILELGMGPGRDLDRLVASGFEAVGSDKAVGFVDRYKQRGGVGKCLVLDAVTIAIEEEFDAVYSNKVLHHLDRDELVRSFRRQVELVGPGGVLLHSFWKGQKTEVHHGLLFTYWERQTLEEILPEGMSIEEVQPYCDIWEGDSIAVVFRVEGPTDPLDPSM